MKIWDVVEGPIHIDDLPEDVDLSDFLDDDGNMSEAVSLVKVEVDGRIEHTTFSFPTFDIAYQFSRYFDKNIEPILVNEEGQMVDKNGNSIFKT